MKSKARSEAYSSYHYYDVQFYCDEEWSYYNSDCYSEHLYSAAFDCYCQTDCKGFLNMKDAREAREEILNKGKYTQVRIVEIYKTVVRIYHEEEDEKKPDYFFSHGDLGPSKA